MSNDLIQIRDVSKSYNGKQILKNINLDIKAGESIALVGHNGTGKSTLLRMIAHLTKMTSGKITYLSNLKINYIPERFPKMNITAGQYIKYMALIEGIEAGQIDKRCQGLFKAFFMESMQNTPMKHLSKGTLQKVAVIQALLVKPSVLLLDEPLSGQDAESQNVFISMMKELKQQGVAIIMSCHESFLINRISDCVYEIKEGHMKRVESEDLYLAEFDVLIFNKEKKMLPIPSELYLTAKSIEDNNNKVKIKVTSDKSNEVLLDMLKAGWQLKEMYHE